MRTLTATARKGGVAVDTLVTQAKAIVGLDMFLPETKRVVDAIKRSSEG